MKKKKESSKTAPQFVLDADGNRAFVVLPIESYETLMEDLEDLAVVAERREDEKISYDKFREQLKAHGKI
ncbi:MAG: hypothetical protein AB7F28_00860 [Candidatus Margulisiibacteriota bacterium]